MPQPLSSKEASLFRQVVKNYEGKQYKKGLKAAEQILRKTPNHGETQAMKALHLNSLGQTDEAFALAKIALKNDMKSHVCWHVYGLLWRSQKNFDEAIKAYKFALRLEPESSQIQRDLALLQIQIRDYQGYIQSRKTILQTRPQLRQNWTAMAIAHHLAGDYASAEKVLTTYEDTLKSPPLKTDIEHSEAALYKTMIIAEGGDVQRALENLESIQKKNLDRTAVMELRAQYLLDLGKKEEAEKAYRALLERNLEYRAYYHGLERALDLSKDDKIGLRDMYLSYAEKHERLDAARRIPLNYLEGDDFKSAADHYLRRMLQKGVPSTFNNIKSLYEDEAKRRTIEELVEDYAAGKQSNGDSAKETNGGTGDRFHEFVLYFLAQHYNYKLTRNLSKAMDFTETLIRMKPQTYDYTMTKARILKHMGNLPEAAKVMNQARELDLKDRYINTKCAKYQLRNNENDTALQTMSKFTRNEAVGGTLGDLLEMQVLWYLTEDGEAHWRERRLGLALKRFHSVYDIFDVWQEDQFDFHSFSLRKGQIRAYVDMVRWEDTLRRHPFYTRAAIDAAKVYIALYDNPYLAQSGLANGFQDMDETERKKAMKKARKEQEKHEKEDAERREVDRKAAAKKSTDGETKKIDLDPRGTKFLETKEPLDMASRFLGPLMELEETVGEVQHVGFELYLRKKKFFLALKCVLGAFALDSDSPTAHEQSIRLVLATKELPEASSTLFSTLLTSLPRPYKASISELSRLNDDFISEHPDSMAYLLGYARACNAIDSSSNQQNQDRVFKMLDQDKSMTLDTALEAVRTLQIFKCSKATLEQFVSRAKATFPNATILDRETGLQY